MRWGHVSSTAPHRTVILADALRGGAATDLRAATSLDILLAAVLVAAWLPIFRHLRDHPELVGPGTDAAFFHARCIRAWVGVIVDAVAVVVATIAPIPALALWTLTLIVLAATSGVVPGIPFLLDDTGSDGGSRWRGGRYQSLMAACRSGCLCFDVDEDSTW